MPSISNSFCVSINASISPAETLLKITSLSDYYFLNLKSKNNQKKDKKPRRVRGFLWVLASVYGLLLIASNLF